jgi:molybdate transport system substrate-binding protein
MFSRLPVLRAGTLAAVFCLASCQHVPAPKPEITIAAAANLTDVFQRIGPLFESRTGIHPVFSFGSTSLLAQQIEHSAPFDVFAAADSEHVAQLDREGLLLTGTRVVYARGILALWIPANTKAPINTVNDLANPDVRFIAIAKPELAPYGEAAVQALQHLNLWQQIQLKIVYAENINIARQYGLSKNADAVFTAYSLVLHEPGKVIRIDESLHAPINQELGILSRSQHVDAAQKFVDFLLRGEGKTVLAQSGYSAP